MNELMILGISFSTIFVVSLIFGGINLSSKRWARHHVITLIFLVASLFSLIAWKNTRIDPKVERRVLPPKSILFANLEVGIYEYVDVWDITPFYLVPMRKVAKDASDKKGGVGSKQPWSFVVFSAKEFRQNNVPRRQKIPFQTLAGFLEVKGSSDKKVCSVFHKL